MRTHTHTHTHTIPTHYSCRREQTRELYAPFESNMKAVSSDVYYHEMPGGQYTNLKFQAMSLGLGEEWSRICQSYAAANRALGDIVKVCVCVRERETGGMGGRPHVYVCVCVCV